MVRRSSNGFTMIEIVIVIIMVGIIGSMAATMLYHGSEIFVKETRRQGFVSEARSAFWNAMRETHGQKSPYNFISASRPPRILFIEISRRFIVVVIPLQNCSIDSNSSLFLYINGSL